MQPPDPVSRRKFIAATSSGVVAASVGSATFSSEKPSTSLAIDGGQPAVTESVSDWVRWGAPERARLDAMVDQSSLFYWNGPQTTAFIERFRQHCPSHHVQTCSSGTAAIHIAAAAAGIGPGDEVITSPITDIGTVIGVLFQQAVPVFADVEPETYNLSPADVAGKITARTKAIIAVHLAGNPCDLQKLKALADKHDLILIEDCAQAWGTRSQGRAIGTVGDIGCFSLMNSKHITTGDGGVVASSHEALGPLLQRFGDKGTDRVDGSPLQALASNYRMSETQAAVGAAQLERLEGIATRRQKLGRILTDQITDVAGIRPHHVNVEDRCTYWFYMFRMDPGKFRCDRAQLVKAMRAEGVPASAGYIKRPLYAEPMFQDHSFFAGRWPAKDMGLTTMDYRTVHCPETEAVLETAIRIPVREHMTASYIHQVAAGIRKVAGHFVV